MLQTQAKTDGNSAGRNSQGEVVSLMGAVDLPEALLSLPIAERIALADKLYASVPEAWQKSADEAWLGEAERRSAEMDADPTTELSLEEFMPGLQRNNRRS